jgi:2-polyprenyl-3-methyl-5-hydroxy-6-metoxy-1,4-benzoquinol methylase
MSERTRQEELIEQYKLVHAAGTYGRGSEFLLGQVQRILSDKKFQPKTILDYGCGRSRLVDWLAKLNDATAYRYEPAIPEFSVMPVTEVDFVTNTDVLEHVAEEAVDETIARIRSLSRRAFFCISTRKAGKILPNGENAHATIKDAAWWEERLRRHFPRATATHTLRPQTCSFVTW